MPDGQFDWGGFLNFGDYDRKLSSANSAVCWEIWRIFEYSLRSENVEVQIISREAKDSFLAPQRLYAESRDTGNDIV